MANTTVPLLDVEACRRPRRQRVAVIFTVVSLFLLVAGVGVHHLHGWSTFQSATPHQPLEPPRSRGSLEGVSDKSSGVKAKRYAWSNDELTWQRTAFHFQPQKNWMNDPNAPMYYKGWYHLFYQYNPYSAVWGNITWGHAVSRDLIHWLYLPLALSPDHLYDHNGVWSGSATLLPGGLPVVLYTGSTDRLVQVQNLAFPANASDPLLLRWTKSTSNPILLPPSGIAPRDFRDPTTAWQVKSDPGAWRFGIGAKDADGAGIVLVYRTRDFVRYELLPGALHRVPNTGMWECVDFYPIALRRDQGLSAALTDGEACVKHVLKASLDDDKHDYYAIGTYDADRNTWTADDPAEADVGLGLRYDYGKFYASKTFYDAKTKRRVLWGWIGETDTESADLLKGWASVQAIPRTVLLDRKTGSNLLQWPVEEVETLRLRSTNFTDVQIPLGSVVPLLVDGDATQLDIIAEFEVKNTTSDSDSEGTLEAEEVAYSCNSSNGASARGVLGPFGLLVLSDEELMERTAVYFYISRDYKDGKLNTFICQDQSTSSLANDPFKAVYGNTVPVLHGEKLSLRILVDHSIVETFAQGGRTCITSRVYPTKVAHYGGARVFLFNNATRARVTATSVNVWQMSSASIRPYPGLDSEM